LRYLNRFVAENAASAMYGVETKSDLKITAISGLRMKSR